MRRGKKMNKNLGKLRRLMGSRSLKIFAKTYFKEYCSSINSRFHEETYEILEEIQKKRDQRVAIAAPREHAKSTIISLIFVLWVACYKMDRCIVVVSHTLKQGEDLLSDVRYAIRQNDLLMQDFPDVCEPPNLKWRKDEIVLRNSIRILSAGTESELRGKKYKQHRPSLIILDDAEQTGDMFSKEVRERLFNWFTKVVLNLGSKTTNIIVTGTIHHYDSLLHKLTSEDEFPGWVKRKYQAVEAWAVHPDLWDKWAQIYRNREKYDDKGGPEAARAFYAYNEERMLEGTKVLWPDKETYYDLMVMKERGSELSFYSEKQNEPLGGSNFWFPQEALVFWDNKFNSPQELLSFLGENKIILGAIDPSMGGSKRSDYSAFITVAFDKRDGTIYVIGADIGRWKPTDLMAKVIFTYKEWEHKQIGFEENGFQQVLGKDLIQMSDKQGSHIPISFIKNTARKEERIFRLEPMIRQGRIQFSHSHNELIQEILHYPKGAYDDGIDALSMVLDVSEKVGNMSIEGHLKIFEILNGGAGGREKGGVIGIIDPITGRYKPFDDPFRFFTNIK
jgi:predicted phage terminase large subunit-like protein